MLPKEQIERIGELSRKQRSGGLTEEEQAEQHALRQAYLAAFRKSFKAQLQSEGLAPAEADSGCGCKDPNCNHHHHHHHLPH